MLGSINNRSTVRRDSLFVIPALVAGTNRGKVLILVPGTSPGWRLSASQFNSFRSQLVCLRVGHGVEYCADTDRHVAGTPAIKEAASSLEDIVVSLPRALRR